MSAAEEKAKQIKGTAVGAVLLAYLKERKEQKITQIIVIKDADIVRQLQGRLQEISELITLVTPNE